MDVSGVSDRAAISQQPGRWASIAGLSRASLSLYEIAEAISDKVDPASVGSDSNEGEAFRTITKRVASKRFSQDSLEVTSFSKSIQKLTKNFQPKRNNQRGNLTLAQVYSLTDALAKLLRRENVPFLDQRATAIGIYSLYEIPSSPQTESYLSALALHLHNAFERDDILTSQSIGNVLYGLKEHGSSEATKAVINEIVLHLKESTQLSPQEIGNALLGLKEHSSSEASEALLTALVPHITHCKQLLDPQAIAHGLFGLKEHHPSEASEAVLNAFVPHIDAREQLLITSQGIGMGLFGLKEHHSSEASEAVLKALVSHIRECKHLGAQVIGMGLYGLKEHHSSEASQAVLKELVSHIKNSKQLTPQNIGNALFGLQEHHSSEDSEAVLRALALHIEKSKQLTPQNIGNALFGLKEHDSSEASEAVLRKLVRHIKGSDQLTPQNIANALYGLKEHDSSEASHAVLEALVPHIRTSDQLTPQNMRNAVYGLKRHTLSEFSEEIINALVPHFERSTKIDSWIVYSAVIGLRNKGMSNIEKIFTALLANTPEKFVEADIKNNFSHHLSCEQASRLLLAECTLSLSDFLADHEGQWVAQFFLQKITAKLFDDKNNFEINFANPMNSVFNLTRDISERVPASIDFHGFSHQLSREIATHYLDTTENNTVTIHFRQNSYGKKRNKMRDVLTSCIKHNNEWSFSVMPGLINVTRKH